LELLTSSLPSSRSERLAFDISDTRRPQYAASFTQIVFLSLMLSFVMAVKDLNGIIRLKELFPEWVDLKEAGLAPIVRGKSITDM
jgi:hypothetical protein